MKTKAVGFAVILALIPFCVALPLFGQKTVTVNFSGGGSTTWAGGPDGNVYAGIYNGTVSGLPGANPGIICDDYKDTIVPGETWTANAVSAASLNSGNIGQTMFGNSIGLDGYAEVATLVSYMFSGHSPYTQAELASAIWYITGGGLVKLSSLDSTAQALVASLQKQFGSLSASGAEAVLAQYANLWILTPALGPGEPQEMWVSVAEGGTAMMYLLLVAGCCFGAMFFRSRGSAASFRAVA
jgi:hypothetical protein